MNDGTKTDRRSFLAQSIGGALVASSAHSAAKPASNPAHRSPFKLKYAPHLGMFRASAGADPIDQLHFMSDHGFTAFEDNALMTRPPELQQRIGDTLARLGMTMGVFVLDKGGNDANSLTAGKPEYVGIFLEGCRRAVDTAKRVNAKWTTMVPGDFVRDLPLGIQTGHVIDALRRGAEVLEPHGLVMVIEALSDNPDLFLRTSDQSYAICRAVNSPACKILYDMYHMQRNEGDMIAHIDLAWTEIAYFQIGNVPDRNEPGTGEVDYRRMFQHLHQEGYTGVLGMEHGNSKPGRDGEAAVIAAYRAADDF